MKSRPSFTLIEIIIAVTLFSILATTGVVLVSNVSKASRKVEMEEYLYTEAQNLLERIAREIQSSGIDYEEYYSREVVQIGTAAALRTFGENYGTYHQQFFHPGSDGNYGALCTDGVTTYPSASGCTPDTSTFDYDTGMNPYDGSGDDPEDANAFCNTIVAIRTSTPCSGETSYYQSDYLFLINKEGTERTFFTKEKGDVPVVAMIQLEGADSDGDGLMEWECTDDYTCSGSDGTGTDNLPYPGDLLKTDGVDETDFKPISPNTIYIDELTFYITPLEDPFKGYTESTTSVFENVQLQPRVTLVLHAHYQIFDQDGNPIVDFSEAGGLIGEAPEITLQTTVGTGVTQVISAYTSP